MAKQSFEDIFEERLRERESQIETRAQSGLPVTSALRRGGTPPKIRGLGITATQGTVSLTWAEANIGDLGRYEIQVSTSPVMAAATEYMVTGPAFVFTEVTPLTTYYFRVRAVNRSGVAGPYSAIQSSLPGTVTTLAIETSAVQEYVKFVKSSGFATLGDYTPPHAGTVTTSETYGPVTFTTTDENTIVVPRYVFDITFKCTYEGAGSINDLNRMTTTLLRRPVGGADSTIATSIIDFEFTIPTLVGVDQGTIQFTLPTFSGADVVGSTGSFEYRLKLETSQTGSTGLEITASNLTIEAFVIRR